MNWNLPGIFATTALITIPLWLTPGRTTEAQVKYFTEIVDGARVHTFCFRDPELISELEIVFQLLGEVASMCLKNGKYEIKVRGGIC